MNRETEKLLEHYHAARELQTKELLTEGDLKKQIRAMRTRGGINTRKLIDYIERGLIPAPLVSGRGVQRMFPRETAAEFDSSVRLASHLPLTGVREAARLARILESCRNSREVLGHVADFRSKEV